jgi:pyruvate dehydrogenase E2 component (dihydrolipoamide acetyltransferase)
MQSIIMPKLGLTMEEGTILQWLRKAGDTVEKGDPLFEVETDKAVNEIEAPCSGTIGKILVQEGETAAVLQVLGYLLESNEDAPQAWPEPGPPSNVAQPEPSTTAPPAPPSPAVGDRAEDKAAATSSPHSTAAGRSRISPRARRLAEEHGISPDEIPASGAGGRLMEKDVLAFLEEFESLQPSRKELITAERLTASFTSTPHFYLKNHIDAGEIIAWREQLSVPVEEESGCDLTLTDLFILLTTRTLERHSRLNASWQAGRIRVFKAVHIGLAVAGPDGLTVPVIRNAHKRTLSEIAAERARLVKKAQAGKLALGDLEGGTFTLSNLGMFGIDEFTAVINPPQSAVLAVGRVAERAAAVQGQAVVRPILTLTLSIDHRVVDGAAAAQFMSDLRAAFEDPSVLLGPDNGTT